MKAYKNYCIDLIKVNLNDLKNTQNPAAVEALTNEIIFYCNEIKAINQNR